MGLGGKGGGCGGGLLSLGNNKVLPKDSSSALPCSPSLVEVLTVFCSRLV